MRKVEGEHMLNVNHLMVPICGVLWPIGDREDVEFGVGAVFSDQVVKEMWATDPTVSRFTSAF
jgi:hypothetical protein